MDLRSRLLGGKTSASPSVPKVSAALAGLLVAAAAHAAPPPAEVFFGVPDLREAELSPSGKRLAFTSAKGSKHIGLVALELGTGGKLTRVVEASQEDVVNVHWVNDDRLVFSYADPSGERLQRQDCSP